MKTLKFYVVCLILFSSCITEDETVTYYVIKNESQQVVTMNIFKKALSGTNTDKVVIQPQKEYKNSFPGHSPWVLDPFSYKTDSVRIIFNQTDSVLHTPDRPLAKNILKFESYTGGMTKNYRHTIVYEYEYAITEQDYQNIKKK